MLVKGIVYTTDVLLAFDCLCCVIRMEGLGPSSLSGDSQRQCCLKGIFQVTFLLSFVTVSKFQRFS